MIPTGPSIDRALRNKAIIEWLTTPIRMASPLLPGTRNTLMDLALGYSSYLGCPLDEVDPLYPDSDYLDFLWKRYDRPIRQYAGEILTESS